MILLIKTTSRSKHIENQEKLLHNFSFFSKIVSRNSDVELSYTFSRKICVE